VAAVVSLLDWVMFSVSGVGAVVAYAVPAFLALAWRRSAPVVVFLVLWAHHLAAAIWLPGYRPTLGLLVALYTVAASKSWRSSAAALVATFATMAPVAVVQELADNPEDPRVSTAVYVTLLYAIISVGAGALGFWARRSRHRLDSLERRSKREAAEAVRAERRRIARELHDIVSHSVSVMVLQAAGARRVFATDPARAEEALAHIEAVGKESMVELRRLLGVLDDGTAGHATEELGPQHGLADVPAMVEGLRLSGLDVSLVVEGTPAHLDPSVDLSAYRIVQEALTNCIKHGRGAIATVRLAWSRQLLIVEVVDDGGKAAAATDPALSTEHGLPGMRERARAVGGHLEAGPDPAGGFRVSATLPVASSGSPDLHRPVGQQG